MIPELDYSGSRTNTGARIFDWSRTSVGAPDIWPAGQRAALRTCLAADIPMALWLGATRLLCWNDAWYHLLGWHKDTALDQPGHEVFQREWVQLGPVLHDTYAQGRAIFASNMPLIVSRNGTTELLNLIWFISPVLDERDQVVALSTALMHVPLSTSATFEPTPWSLQSPTTHATTMGLDAHATSDNRSEQREHQPIHEAYAYAFAEREELVRRALLARREAQAAHRLIEEFLAIVSHELRTPLTALLGYAQMLQVRRHDQTYVLQTIDKVVHSAKAQAKIIEELLDSSLVMSEQFKLVPEPIEIEPIVHGAVETVQAAVLAKEQTLVLNCHPNSTIVLGDPQRLHQVFVQLLTNATKFTPFEGIITIDFERRKVDVAVIVSDTGQGMSPAFVPHAFGEFRQEDNSLNRVHNGLGLGLTLVRRIVELHGGTVSGTSEGIGRGARFTVVLPRLQHHAPLHSEDPDTR